VKQYRKLLDGVGHRFNDEELLTAALTHRSAGGKNNERLEFLGDAVLGLVIAEALYRRRERAREGELSRLRAMLVRRQTLAEIARELMLGDYLVLGSGEQKSGGFRRDSILADALEAVLGAIYQDAGFDRARGCILRLFASRLEALPEGEAGLKDPKTRLQEVLQGRGHALPAYVLERVTGEAHDQRFSVSCEVASLDLCTRGNGTSRQKAEQEAAGEMLNLLASEHGLR
jgi:ribonuclease-3